MENTMTPEQALKIIGEVCASVQANLATHNQIQAALQVIGEGLNEAPTPRVK